jgi:hypothetical protein
LPVKAALRGACCSKDDNVSVACGIAHCYLFRSETM